MYIKTVTLKNFMRYENQVVELDPGFNAFVGPTDSGKSTILRAIIWVMYGRPLGMEMCRYGTDETEVTLEVCHPDRTQTISRIRSKKRNAYCLNGQYYDAVKTGVPEEVQSALGVSLADLGPKVTEMLNVSRQMDGPFMLSGTGGDAAKILGNLSGITKIDAGLSTLRPDLTKVKAEIVHADKLERTYTAALHEYSDLVEEGILIKEASLRIRKAQELTQKVEQLILLEQRMDEYNKTVATIQTDLNTAKSKLMLLPQFTTAQALAQRITNLDDLAVSLIVYNKSIETNQDLISKHHLLISNLEQKQNKILHEAGTCPLCGSSTSGQSL